MTSTTPRIITIALAVLALAVPAASGAPQRDSGPAIHTSSLAGTTSAPEHSLRNPVNRAPIYVPPVTDNRGPVYAAPAAPTHARIYVPPVPDKPHAPAHVQQPVADDGGTSPLVYILPGLVLVGMLGAALAFARTPRRTPA